MNDLVIARIRTWWPVFLGHLVALLVTWLASTVGIHVDSAIAFEALGAAASLGVWELGRWLEHPDNPPWMTKAGSWLLALGAAVGPPTYQPPPADPQP